VIGAGHDRFETVSRHRIGNRLGIGCDNHPPQPGFLRPAGDLNDHGQACDLSERFSGQS
jgi:hypothetical protein